MNKEETFNLIKQKGLLKTVAPAVVNLTSEQKVLLNRKANELFNLGKFDEAEKLFRTTGYSDGLRRMAEIYYKERKDPVTALMLLYLSGDKKSAENLIENAAKVIQELLNTKE